MRSLQYATPCFVRRPNDTESGVTTIHGTAWFLAATGLMLVGSALAGCAHEPPRAALDLAARDEVISHAIVSFVSQDGRTAFVVNCHQRDGITVGRTVQDRIAKARKGHGDNEEPTSDPRTVKFDSPEALYKAIMAKGAGILGERTVLGKCVKRDNPYNDCVNVGTDSSPLWRKDVYQFGGNNYDNHCVPDPQAKTTCTEQLGTIGTIHYYGTQADCAANQNEISHTDIYDWYCSEPAQAKP